MDRLRRALLEKFEPGHAPAPIEATFRVVLNQLEGIGMLEAFSEEEITAALLGGFAAAYPLCLGVFTNNQTQEQAIVEQHRCSWGQYNKSRTDAPKDNETDRGADFALVIWVNETNARVALFQAKRFEGSRPRGPEGEVVKRTWPAGTPDMAGEPPLSNVTEGEYFLDVRRARRDESGKIVGLTQIETLARTAKRIELARRLAPADRKPYLEACEIVDAEPFSFRNKKPDEDADHYGNALEIAKDTDRIKRAGAQAIVKDFESRVPDAPKTFLAPAHWVHYLGYARVTATAANRKQGNGPGPFKVGTVCVALSALSAQLMFDRIAFGSVHSFIGEVNDLPKRNLVDLAKVPCYPFVNVILSAFSAPPDSAGQPAAEQEADGTGETVEDVAGWITLDADTIGAALPALLQFGHVFMGTDKGGRGHELVQALRQLARPTPPAPEDAAPTAEEAKALDVTLSSTLKL